MTDTELLNRALQGEYIGTGTKQSFLMAQEIERLRTELAAALERERALPRLIAKENDDDA